MGYGLKIIKIWSDFSRAGVYNPFRHLSAHSTLMDGSCIQLAHSSWLLHWVETSVTHSWGHTALKIVWLSHVAIVLVRISTTHSHWIWCHVHRIHWAHFSHRAHRWATHWAMHVTAGTRAWVILVWHISILLVSVTHLTPLSIPRMSELVWVERQQVRISQKSRWCTWAAHHIVVVPPF
jgi:hypothetical protein